MQQIDYRLSDPFLDAFEQVQDGQFISNIADQFGLSHDQARLAVDELAKPLRRSIRGNTATREGLAAFLNALATGNHAQYVETDNLLGNDAIREDGNAILGHLFGSRDVSRAVAKRASFGTGIGAAILKKLLPYIASVVMGMIAKRMSGGGGGISLPGGTSRPSSSGGAGGGWFGGGGGDIDDLLGDLSRQSQDAMGTGGSNYAPEANAGGEGFNPFDRMRDVVNQPRAERPRNARVDGGFIRDVLGKSLGGRSKGIMGSIVSFLIYKYGWGFAKRLLGSFLGRR